MDADLLRAPHGLPYWWRCDSRQAPPISTPLPSPLPSLLPTRTLTAGFASAQRGCGVWFFFLCLSLVYSICCPLSCVLLVLSNLHCAYCCPLHTYTLYPHLTLTLSLGTLCTLSALGTHSYICAGSRFFNIRTLCCFISFSFFLISFPVISMSVHMHVAIATSLNVKALQILTEFSLELGRRRNFGHRYTFLCTRGCVGEIFLNTDDIEVDFGRVHALKTPYTLHFRNARSHEMPPHRYRVLIYGQSQPRNAQRSTSSF